MRNPFLNLIVLSMIAISANAQNITLREVQEQNFARRISTGSGMGANQIAQLPMISGEKITEVYMSNSWQKSIVSLYGSEEQIIGVPAKYELKNNTVELKVNDQVKVMDV